MLMKTNFIKNIILLLSLATIILSGCKKKPFDYRNKYLGNYHIINHSQINAPPPYFNDTSYSTEGKVEYGSDKNKILITFDSENSSEFIIYEDGTLESSGCSGGFESVNKFKYHCGFYSPGATTSINITGEKK